MLHRAPVACSLPLPVVSAEAPLAEVGLRRPTAVQAGKPFPMSITCRNGTAAIQDVDIQVGDSGSVVVEGVRTAVMTIKPAESASLEWTLASYSSGSCHPPDILLTFRQLDKVFRCPRQPITVVSESGARAEDHRGR